jgi:hypothetical protein
VDFITPSIPRSPRHSASNLRSLGALGAGRGAGAETVGELAVDGLEVTHAAGTGGLPALGLLAPVDCAALVARPWRYRAGGQPWVYVHFLVLAAG